VGGHYEKGRRFEWAVRDYLRSMGFLVIRAAASKPVDLVAVKDGKIYLVECKYDAGMTRHEKTQLVEEAERAGAIPLLATKRRGESRIRLINLLLEGVEGEMGGEAGRARGAGPFILGVLKGAVINGWVARKLLAETPPSDVERRKYLEHVIREGENAERALERMLGKPIREIMKPHLSLLGEGD
jgi:Holliday junction resolvase